MTRAELDRITESIIGAGIAVHKELGPGLLESAYEACMVHELMTRNLQVERQKELPVIYRGTRVDCGYRLDLLVEDAVIVELKVVEKIDRIHEAQIISYLRLADKPVGLLMNFHVTQLVKGIKRFAHVLPA